MKKSLLIMLCGILLVSTGCGNKVEEEPKDTLETINLSDNVYVIEEEYNPACGGYAFIEKDSLDSTKPLFKADFVNHLDKYTINEEAEQEALKNWKKVKAPEYGIINFDHALVDHLFTYSYYSIRIVNEDLSLLDSNSKYYELNQKLSNNATNFSREIVDGLGDRSNYTLIMGPCADYGAEAEPLTMKLCNKYNLVCVNK